MDSHKKLYFALLSILIILNIGTVGYILLEGWSFLDSLYMTVITLTTVGFSEVHPLSRPESRIFTIIIIVIGMSVVLYSLSNLAETLVEGQIKNILGRRKVKKRIDSLRDHYVVCGFGRIGSAVCRELAMTGVDFVVIEKDLFLIQKLENEGYLMVVGDATDENALKAAGIERAKGLIPAVSTDADNVYIILTARGLNPNLFIVARAAGEDAERKLLMAGANRVVSPYNMSGKRIANLLLRPTVVEFIESSLFDPTMDLIMEELYLPEDSPFVDKTLQNSGLRRDYNMTVVAMKRIDGHMVVNPSPQEVLKQGDTLIALGKRDDFKRISNILAPRRLQKKCRKGHT